MVLARCEVKTMRTAWAAVLAVALLASPFLATAAADPLPERGVPVVEVGRTARFDGGAWVLVRIGDVSLGVIWTTEDTERPGVRFFVDYTRYFGAAEVYDERGNLLRTTPLPVHTVLMQTFGTMVEFRDADGDGLFDLELRDRDARGEHPVKVLDLSTAWHLDGEVDRSVTEDAAWVNFTLAAERVPYREVFDAAARTWRRATPEDGALDRVSLTFRLEASAERVRLEVPFYRVTVGDGREGSPLRSEFLGNRTIEGTSLAVEGKYDQTIEGWDFAGPDTKLALGTHLSYGVVVDRPVVAWLRAQFGAPCMRDHTFEHCEDDADRRLDRPTVLERDRLTVAEEWHRAGEMTWVSDVTVDGRPDRMTFEIYRAGRTSIPRGDRVYEGFRAFGAFVYPQGHTIVHDPGLSAASYAAPIAAATNLVPATLGALQLAVVALALVPAVLLRRRRRNLGPEDPVGPGR